jgi:hypothetical protein
MKSLEKMANFPKFLFCENPILNERHDARSFILHLQPPVLVAEIFNYENLSDSEILEIQKKIQAGSRLDYGFETFFFVLIYIDPSYFEKNDPQYCADNIAGILRRMADWFEAYLNWEDSQN